MIKPAVVDKVLGPGTYERWQKVQDAFIEEQTRAYTNEERYSGAWGAGLKKQLQADLAFSEKVTDDYLAFLDRVSSAGTANVREGEKILDVYVLAISILTSVNDVLDAIYGLGIVSLFRVLAAAGLESEARALQSLLKKLEQELEKARREVKEAWAQMALNGAITAALACAGPLGWLTLGAVGLGQMVADTYLGPSTSDAATRGSRANTALGTATSASKKYLDESSRVLKVAKPAGKVIPVVGFFFDVNEIAVGYSNADVLKKRMTDTKAAHEKLVGRIQVHKATLSALALKIGNLRGEVEKRRAGSIAQTRETLEDEIRRGGYRPRI